MVARQRKLDAFSVVNLSGIKIKMVTKKVIKTARSFDCTTTETKYLFATETKHLFRYQFFKNQNDQKKIDYKKMIKTNRSKYHQGHVIGRIATKTRRLFRYRSFKNLNDQSKDDKKITSRSLGCTTTNTFSISVLQPKLNAFPVISFATEINIHPPNELFSF